MIELIVALFIFAIVMTISIGSLVTTLDANKKSQSLKSVLNNLEVALDTMTRSIAVGRLYLCSDDATYIAFSNPTPVDCPLDGLAPDGHAAISFLSNEDIDHDGNAYDVIIYRYNPGNGSGGYIERKRFLTAGIFLSGWGNIEQHWIRMTAPEVNITDMKFFVDGSNPAQNGDFNQPKVLITIKGTVPAGARNIPTDFSVQTTVTQLTPDF